MRERIDLGAVAVGAAASILVIAAAVYVGYQWYQSRYGSTPQRALDRYFSALAGGEYDVMYDMTPDGDLMVLGRKLSRGGFAEQVEQLLTGEELEMEDIELDPVAQRGEYHYFRVILHYRLGGTGKVARLLVELRKDEQDWKVTYPFTPSL